MQYRREIDGLRAVAVVPVILFHAGLQILPGGFVGVDVFFVLSGYLITTLLLMDLASGQFSIAAFYERRARRILPALFTVMAVSIPIAFVTMLPSQIEDFSTSLVASVLFLSNFFFLSQVGYFSPDAELQPLLHIWSLSVEEQFYLLFPPALAVLWRKGTRRLTWVLASVAVVSLVFSHWAGGENAARNFYFTGSRIWELLAGALAALTLQRRSIAASNVLAGAGLALIVAAMLGLGATAPVPGFWTLIPVLGTVLVILFAGTGTWTARLLSMRGFVGIGLISYSAYLWHQPLFAFARLHWVAEPPMPVMLGLAGLALLLAWATWAWVEQPFRRRSAPRLPMRKQLFNRAALVGAGLLAIGALGVATDGLEFRLTARQSEVLSYLDYDRASRMRTGRCFLDAEQSGQGFGAECKSGADGIILGDSHAAALSSGLRELGDFAQLTASGCAPVASNLRSDRQNCPDVWAEVMKQVKATQPRMILLHSDWHVYIRNAEFESILASSIRDLRTLAPDARIVVVGGVPQWLPSLPEVLVMHGQDLSAEARTGVELSEVRAADKQMQEIAAAERVSFVSLLDRLCSDEKCLSIVCEDGTCSPMAWDRAHLTHAGAQFISRAIWPELAP